MKNDFLRVCIKCCFVIIALSLYVQCKSKEAPKEDAINAGKEAQKIKELSKLLSERNDKADLFYLRALEYQKLKAFDEALFDVNSAKTIDSSKIKYTFLESDIYLEYFQSRLALVTLQKAISRFPDSLSAYLRLAKVQIILKQYESSMQSLKQIMDKDPQNAEAYLLMGQNFEENKELKRAVLSYKKATEYDPYLIDAWIGIGLISEKTKQEDPKIYYSTALKIDSVNYDALYAMAFYYQNRQNNSQAFFWFNKLNKLFPTASQPFFNQGVIYLEMDSLTRSLQMFNKCIELNPIYSEAYYGKGVVLEKKGRDSSAMWAYQQAFSLDPQNKTAQEDLERIKIKLKKNSAN